MSEGLRQKAIENPLDISYVATQDYVCQLPNCKKLVPRGKSHAHPSTRIPVSELRKKKQQQERAARDKQRRAWLRSSAT
jgi:hypothetical protein